MAWLMKESWLPTKKPSAGNTKRKKYSCPAFFTSEGVSLSSIGRNTDAVPVRIHGS